MIFYNVFTAYYFLILSISNNCNAVIEKFLLKITLKSSKTIRRYSRKKNYPWKKKTRKLFRSIQSREFVEEKNSCESVINFYSIEFPSLLPFRILNKKFSSPRPLPFVASYASLFVLPIECESLSLSTFTPPPFVYIFLK